MEMDRQTLMVLFGAIIAMTLFGSFYLAAPEKRREARPVYAEDDIRSKIQKEEAKKKAVKAPPAPMTSKSRAEVSEDEEPIEEPTLEDGVAHEEPPLE
jgi:hypothetical protein